MKELQDDALLAAVEAGEENSSAPSVSEILHLCLQYWYWFVISVVVCAGLGILKVKRATPIYQRTALIQIRDDDQGSSLNSSIANTFADLGMSSASSNVNNELIAIRSPRLLQEVVEKLNLQVSCTYKKDMRKLPLYGTALPYQITELEDFKHRVRFRVTAAEGAPTGHIDKFIVTYPGNKNVKMDWEYEFETSAIDTIATPEGTFIIKPSAVYTGPHQPEIEMEVSCTSILGAIKSLETQLTSSLTEEDASVITLTLSNSSQVRADDILNTLIEVYNQSWVDDRNQMARATSLFINERLIDIESELSNVDTDISSYKSKNLVPDVDEASRLYLEKANRTSDEIQNLRNQLTNAHYVRDFMSNPSHSKTFLPGNSGFPGIDTQILEYNKLMGDRNSLVASSSEANPRVQLYDSQIAEMRKAILMGLDNQIVALNNALSSLERSEAGANARIAANPTQAKYLLNVERQQKVKEALYLFLLQKREENELSQAFAPYNTRVLQYASGSGTPISPRPMMTLAMAFFLGLLIPAGVIYVRELMDTKVRSRRDVENLNIPFLGEIPLNGKHQGIVSRMAGRDKDKPLGILVSHGKSDNINEAFRLLRSNLEFMTRTDKDKCKVIMVTSAIPSSGKTFVSMNLAAALALKNTRVLLIDLDLRRHSMSSQLAENSRRGVSAYLAGSSDSIADLIAHDVDGYDNLDLLSSGAVPPNPSELLSGKRLEEIVEYAREHYDLVILDCPPTEAVADARVIARLCDMTLYIVRIGNLDRGFLPTLQRINTEGRYGRMAIVVNGAETHGVHSYGYSYGYGYGYGRKEK